MPDVFTNETSKNGDVLSKKKSDSENHFHGLSAFCENPQGMTFQTQDSDETVLLFLRRHIITNVPWIFITIILLLLPFLFIVFPIVDTSSLPQSLILIILLLYYLLVGVYAFVNFLSWFFNITLVSQRRIFDLDFSSLVYHDVTETKLNLVEDVRYTQSGFIRSFFNFGDLFVQTAAEKENIEGLAVPNPGRAVRIVGDLIGKGPQHV